MRRLGSRYLILADHEIHLWSSSVLKPNAVREDLYRVLSPDEREKAARFRFEKDRNAYLVSRSLLRSILSQYVGIEPQKLHFTYGPKGKPALLGNPVCFNMSHSEDVVLYVVAREPKLGVDVEFIRPMSDTKTIAERFFSTIEYGDLLSLGERTEGFFNCWTRKEAYIKATGDGLSAPLDEFQVTLKPREPAAFITIRGDKSLAAEWSLFDWKPGEQYAGAVAVFGRGWYITEKSFELVFHFGPKSTIITQM